MKKILILLTLAVLSISCSSSYVEHTRVNLTLTIVHTTIPCHFNNIYTNHWPYTNNYYSNDHPVYNNYYNNYPYNGYNCSYPNHGSYNNINQTNYSKPRTYHSVGQVRTGRR